MLFGFDLCRRKTTVRKRPQYGNIAWKLLACLIAAGALALLLFFAPQWLLVLLVIALTAAVMALVFLPASGER